MANLKGLTVEINGNVTGLEKALKSVNSTIKETSSQLKDIERLLKLDPTNTELLSQKQEALKEKIGATKEKLDALKTAQEQAKAQMENGDLGKDKYDTLQREIIATEEELKKLAKEAAEANTALTKIGEAGKSLESMGNKMSSVGSSLTRNVTAPILALGTAAVKTTMDFDAAMSQVSAVSGATGKEFDALREKAREMGAKTKFSATEAAEAFNYMAMAGWKTGDMLDGIEGIMALAAASGEDLATTSDIVTDALTAFGMTAADSGHFADVLAAASSNANTNVSMMGESFKMAASVCGALGISAEDASIALGLMANAGIKGSQAGSSLRTGLVNLSKPTKQMKTYMKKYNIELKTNADGSVNLRETMVNLRTQMSGLSETQQAAALSAIFGKNSMAAWAAIVNATDEDFEKLTASIDGCDGAAEQMAETMQDNLQGQLTILKSALQELMIQIGDALMPTIRKIVSVIQGWVEKLQQMDEGTRNTILKLAALAAAIGPVLVVVGKLTTAVGKGMQAFSTMGKSILTLINQTKLGVGPLASLKAGIAGISAPVVAVVAAIGVLVAAFIHLWNTNEEFRQKVTAIWERVKAAFQKLADKIKELLGGIEINFSSVTQVLADIWDGFCQVLAPIIEGALNAVAILFEHVMNVIVGILDIFQGAFTGDWKKVWEGVKSIFTSMWNAIKGFFQNILSTLENLANVFLGLFSTNWQEAWTGIKSFFVNTWEAIKAFISNAWTEIKTAVTTACNSIKSGIEKTWNDVSTFLSNTTETIKRTVTTGWEILKSGVAILVENTKTSVTNTWNNIKDAVSTTVEEIKTAVTEKWEALKTGVTTVVENVKTTVSTAWTNIKETVSTIADGIRDSVTMAWETLKTNVTNTLNGIKETASNVWNGIKSTVSGVVDGIKNGITNGFNAAKSSVTNIFNGIKTGISNALNTAKNTVSNVINRIKSLFNFSWSLPKLKMPHVKITGKFSLSPLQVPHFSISWYKKAMEDGMILNRPTIFGAQGNTLLGGGEAGSEAVVGTHSLMEMIRNAVDSMSAGNTVNYGGVYITVNAAEGQDEMSIARNVADIIQNQVGREAAVWA